MDLYGWILERIKATEQGVRDQADAMWQVWIGADSVAVVIFRRCAADRKLLELHKPQQDGSSFPDSFQCRTCSQDGGDGYQYLVPAPCPTVLALAEGYGWTGP